METIWQPFLFATTYRTSTTSPSMQKPEAPIEIQNENKWKPSNIPNQTRPMKNMKTRSKMSSLSSYLPTSLDVWTEATAAGMLALPWMIKVTPGRTVTVLPKVWSPAVHVVFASNVSGVVTLTPSPMARAEPVVLECASSLLVAKLLLVAGLVWETVLVCVPVLVVVAVETALPEVVDTATAWKAATASSKPATSCR